MVLVAFATVWELNRSLDSVENNTSIIPVLAENINFEVVFSSQIALHPMTNANTYLVKLVLRFGAAVSSLVGVRLGDCEEVRLK